MSIHIISIGAELLNGRTINTNARYIAKKIFSSGFSVKSILTISDTKKALTSAFKNFSKKNDLIICSGGLGPTNDDITRQVVSDFFGQKLINFESEEQRLKKLFENHNLKKGFKELNRYQSYYPENALIFPNNVGSASGFMIATKKSHFIFLPGVPIELKYIIDTHVIPYLVTNYMAKKIIYTKLFRTINIAESILYKNLRTLINENSKLDFSFYPHFMLVDVYIQGNKQSIEIIIEKLNKVLLKISYSESERCDIIDIIQSKLTKKNENLSVAESCTGGLLSAKLTEKSGISKCFRGGLVAYDNEMKHIELGVNYTTLKKYGAVSESCVKEMARGAQLRFKTTYAVAISGIAGPTGASKEKKIGMVCFALASPDGIETITRHLGTERASIQERAVQYALFLLWRKL